MIAAYLTMIIVSFIATIACIPPFIQCCKEKDKPCMWFSIAMFLLMSYLTIKLIVAMIRFEIL